MDKTDNKIISFFRISYKKEKFITIFQLVEKSLFKRKIRKSRVLYMKEVS